MKSEDVIPINRFWRDQIILTGMITLGMHTIIYYIYLFFSYIDALSNCFSNGGKCLDISTGGSKTSLIFTLSY